MNDLHTRIVVCCYRGRVGTDLSVWVACWDFCIRILAMCLQPWAVKLIASVTKRSTPWSPTILLPTQNNALHVRVTGWSPDILHAHIRHSLAHH